MIRNQGDQFAVRNTLSICVDTEGSYAVPDDFERKLIQVLEENIIFHLLATVIRTNSSTRKIKTPRYLKEKCGRRSGPLRPLCSCSGVWSWGAFHRRP